ncbi:MAG: RS21-C6 protein [Candidatus Lloydbacteria bacterium RIFCSPHIGHO2_02_FULL_54_17]|uniref:RS21-C6 protein n=1 Tax=Candidatus Lloydbacteria bacterium RIFCSPHIGHO2_02_FULL_54_17 TaxID=1798664 RepID=A0A1G2DEL6_9BACT|nr:MAG: RS21-C6 protein [Candidatus Lloydbacteria bacterium RIFCSPHIGHO2_01_FULL_54_11]OGZ11310.1 MAG: RS21-C6 protein [Candidatus Lloydbacteria bacterium RIFCSPHIGHO2_02_FULL_54_17]OGZ13798.1 MAG: RS21-C6 protein [Candidatus Lloydbacteria bacterium RIFCSPLOWO2_01_FULL_54_18]OGZ16653.1 MAG: RS21-C6 protein [Candidatus Lloydbacteria bacterium RIFCSPLOWO2_02_FULL_54_12]
MATLKNNPTLADLQDHIAKVCAERGWDKNTHTEKFLLFVEEVGELAKEIRNTTGLHAKKPEGEAHQALEAEFADTLNYLLDLANTFNVDLETAYREKHRVNETRKWD